MSNPLVAGMAFGTPIVVTEIVGTVQVPDHRSPSRAARRAKLGHPQCFRTAGRMVFMEERNCIYAHPLAYAVLEAQMAAKRSKAT